VGELVGGWGRRGGLFSAACLYYTCGLMMELFSPFLFFLSLSVSLSLCFEEDGEG
jgi:hypothetical protein